MRVKQQSRGVFALVGTVLLSGLLAGCGAQTNEDTLIGADSNSINVLDPRKLNRASNPNALAINSLTGSPVQAQSPQSAADGKSNDTHLIFATHVTERAPQLATQAGLTNQLGQTVYLQAQAQPQPQQQQQQPHQQQGQFLYPQPSPVQGPSLGGHPQGGLNAPGASSPYLLHPGYGVQYVQYVPRPVVMPNYPPPPSVYGQHPAHYSNVPVFSPAQPHHPHAHFHAHPSHHSPGIPHAATQFILPPPPGHHTISSPPSLANYSPHHHHHHSQQASLQPLQQQQQQPSHHHNHHPQTHFLVGPSHPSPPSPTPTYASGSAVGPHQQSQLQAHQQNQQAQATAQPSTYLTYSPQSQHYQHSQPQHTQHQQQVHSQSPSPTAQSTNIVPNHVQPPQQPFTTPHHHQQHQQPLIGSYSHQSPLYASYSAQPQAQRYASEPQDSFLNTNEYLPVQFDNSQYRPIKRRNAKF